MDSTAKHNGIAVAALLAGAAAIAVSPLFVKVSETGPIATGFRRIALALPFLWAWSLAGSGGRGATGRADRQDNVLTQAPHTAAAVTTSDWPHPYSREAAAYPLPYLRAHKFWPAVGRVDNPYGDRNFVCSCPPVEEYA